MRGSDPPDLSQAVEHVLIKRPLLKLIKVADGTKDNWTYLENNLPQGDCVLDFYHAPYLPQQ
ncbi:MAG: hypothetical protein V3R68_05610 [Gammaproteobacteria bacterium]